MSEGRHDYFPHPVSETLRNRYGDCKDKSTLLWALLERAGVASDATLVSTIREDPAGLLLPGVAYFDHMVVCLTEPDGGRRCLDPTDAYSVSSETPGIIQGHVALALRPDATPDVVPGEMYRWRMAVDVELAFDAAGDQRESTAVAFQGAYAGDRRAMLSTMNPDERRMWAVQRYQSVVSDQVKPEVTFAGLSKLADPVQIRFGATYEDLVAPDAPLDYREQDAWLNDLIGYFLVDNEHYAYSFPGFSASSTYRFRSDGHWQLMHAGAELDFDHEFGQLRRSYVVGESEVLVRTSIAVPRRVVAVNEMDDFRRFLRLLQRETMMSIGGRRAAD